MAKRDAPKRAATTIHVSRLIEDIERTASWLSEKGHSQEIEWDRRWLLKPALENIRSGTVPSADFDILQKYFNSIILWRAHLELGEDFLLLIAPGLVWQDLYFHLGRPWLRRLVSNWHGDGEEAKIKQLFFGKPGRGKRTYSSTTKNLYRDLRIIRAVEELLDAGTSFRKAVGLIATDPESYRVHEKLSPSRIRAIYEKRDRVLDPLQKLLSPGIVPAKPPI